MQETSKIKIAFLIGSLNRGGKEVLLLDILKSVQGNADSIFCIHRKKGDLYQEFHNTTISLIELKPFNKFDISYPVRFRKQVIKNDIQILHAYQPVDAFIAWLSCIGLKNKIVLTLHGHNFGLGLIKKHLLKTLLNSLHAIIFVSNTQFKNYKKRKLIKTKNSDKHFVVYNGLAPEKFNSDPVNLLRDEFDIPKEALVIGTVGNFGPGRDPYTICKFLKLLHGKGIEFRFIFVGAKNLEESWRYDQCIQYIEENGLENEVWFLGSRNDVPQILNQLDAFIYSSEHDTFGIAVVEAMAAGVPAIVNDIDIMREIVQYSEQGIIFESKNEIDLLEKFQQFLQNKTSYKQKAIDVSVKMHRTLSINNHFKALLGIYSRL